ncbi:bifunctional glycosyltransferase family 2/GtrA family protein [Microbacterium invictum]|uniref:Bifunctional glycosyltransferase family 2/GtrA family protein n=1 Tax=Microbacterium invictum TaxID=515415 RepID=A0ABZ0VED5_9MICO|nr:bifunctional glycosyltransferase family 2/GtrA family protein [Microbacterium invictum]WQB71192.1 bifunctional glycosyltransferase family 2/GtrA family protein [Microbacterium invictum]
MIVLVPAYQPGAALPALVERLTRADVGSDVVVVDDGSGPAFAGVFDEAARRGATVITHPLNRGKGAALKTGIRDILARFPGHDVVTADADGQHIVHDIQRVADALASDVSHQPALVLGARAFRGTVPLRSRVGNTVARGLFRIAAGWNASDTQTGLRGIPAGMLPWLLDVPGERFEYETEMLLRLRSAGFEAREIAVDTIYLESNTSSHFRPIIDSVRVTAPLLAFAASSLLAFLVDTIALLVLTAMTGSLIGSIVGARLLSATVNFVVNRQFVFRRRGRQRMIAQGLGYVTLALLLLGSNVVWMTFLTDLGLPLLAAKVITETVLAVTSYQVQRRVIFAGGRTDPERQRRLAPSQERPRSTEVPGDRMNLTIPRRERTP